MRFAVFLIAATFVRLVVAATMPVSADEAYYWVWSKALAPGYLDHPPMVALWIWAGTHIAGDSALGVRLLGPLAAAAGSWLLIGAGRDLQPGGRVGTRAAWLLNGTLVLNAGAVLITPDTPLLLFWTACLAALARLARTGDGRWWLAAGVAAGLALDSKYTAVLLAPCMALWVMLVPSLRPWLRRWQPYAGGALALALFAPVLAWNAAHGWASFAKQGGREGDWHPALALAHLAELVGGQIGLATPLLFVVFCLGAWRLARAGGWQRPEPALVLIFVALPSVVFLQHALGGRVQANWPGVIYPAAALAAAMAAPWLWRTATGLGLAISALVFLQAAAAPLVLPRRYDFTLIRLGGWPMLARQVEAAAAAAHAGFIAADEYGLAAELAFQPAPAPEAQPAARVVAVEARWALFAHPPAALAGQTGILVRSDRRRGAPDAALWPGALAVGHLTRGRAGVAAETYTLYQVAAPAHAAAGTVMMLPPRA